MQNDLGANRSMVIRLRESRSFKGKIIIRKQFEPDGHTVWLSDGSRDLQLCLHWTCLCQDESDKDCEHRRASPMVVSNKQDGLKQVGAIGDCHDSRRQQTTSRIVKQQPGLREAHYAKPLPVIHKPPDAESNAKSNGESSASPRKIAVSNINSLPCHRATHAVLGR